MLAPVEPARAAAFSLNQNTADGTPATGSVLPTEGISSSGLHSDDTTQQDTNGTTDGGSGKQPKSIVRAWLLAGATRWGRGGGTQNKRLDMKKARAAAHQVKEARQVVVNKSGGLGGGTSGGGRPSNASGTGSSKGLGSKASKGGTSSGAGSAKGPKNSSASGAGRGPSGRDTSRSTDRPNAGAKPGAGSAGAGRGTSGGTSSGSKTPNPKPTADQSRTPKPPKGDHAHAPKSPAGGSPSGAKGAAGTPGKAGPAGKTDQPKKTPDTPKGAKADADKASTGKTDTGSDSTKKTTAPAPVPAGKGTSPATDTKSPKLSLTKRKGKTDPAPAGASDTKQAAKPTSKADDIPKTSTPEKTPTTPKGGKGGTQFTTRPSRETGYRDGTRAAKATAHVKAYRDGLKDGYTDTTQAADREKARLDKARDDRKTARKDQPVHRQPDPMDPLDPLNTVDPHPPNGQPEPIPVKEVTSTHIHLGAGASRASMTRGEVRTLKSFERRLEEKLLFMLWLEEKSEGVASVSRRHANEITQLAEAARAVEGGDKLLGKLAKLQETAAVQATLAEQLYSRAIRGIEGTHAVLGNVRSRYDDMFQAVVDSPETSPAELDFYTKG